MTETKKGNIFILSEMVLWSLFPIVSLLGLKGLPSIVSLFWVNLFCTIFFFLIMVFKNRWHELKNKQLWYYILGAVIFIHIIFYGLYFFALGKTVPTNAAIVALFEIVPSYIIFQIIKKERLDRKHIFGIVLAIIGALIVLLPGVKGIHTGDLIILGAVFFAPFGNWCQQQARKISSTETTLFLRHLLATPFLFILIYFMGFSIEIGKIENVIGWLLLNSILIFGVSKILWVEAIHRMSVTKALAINSLNPVFTMLFSWLLLMQLPTPVQFISLPFLVLSIIILTDFKFSKMKFR